jgi:hypothetical protein
VAKILRQQKTVIFFNFRAIFQRSVMHSSVEREAHQAIAIKAGKSCASVQFQHYSLHCFGIVLYKIL